jgi:hypothetical protein
MPITGHPYRNPTLVSTEGIQTAHTGLLEPPLGHGQQEFYTVIRLTGTAAHALLP